jgi:hypothetical protein
MDWPVIGAITGVTIVAGAVIFEVIAFVKADPEPVKTTQVLSSYGSSVERSANELPGFATGKSGPPAPSFPLIRLIDPDRTFPIDGDEDVPQAAAPAPPSAVPRKAPAPSVSATPDTPSDLKVAKLTPPEQRITAPDIQPRADQWKVLVTSKASYFNLGGHVDSNGIVDSLASSRLRDALKEHKNFARLPPDIRTHILTQNINLAKVAPYRGLLGIDDKRMEEEQAIRFERVVSTSTR